LQLLGLLYRKIDSEKGQEANLLSDGVVHSGLPPRFGCHRRC